MRLLGLAITDQFTGDASDRYAEAGERFSRVSASEYRTGLSPGHSRERKAKAQLRAGRPPHTVLPIFEEAMNYFEEAEKIRPADNDDAILRWNRCVRLLQSRMGSEWQQGNGRV